LSVFCPAPANSSSDVKVSTNAVLISTLNNYQKSCGYPLQTSHQKILQITETATNTISMDRDLTAWVDFMIRPYRGTLPADSSSFNASQLSLSFDEYGHPAIWHYDTISEKNRWTVINEITIYPNQWLRLTLKVDYQTTDSVRNLHYAQIRLNGILITNALAWSSNDNSGALDGSWFALPPDSDQISSMSYHISDGVDISLDDVVITTTNPLAKTVKIISANGTPEPPAGIYSYTYGDNLYLSLSNSEQICGTTQFVSTGWNMSGHSPQSSTATNLLITTLTNDMALTWEWTTNYWLQTMATGEGSASPSNQWVRKNSEITLTAKPFPYYHFTSWSGDLSGSNASLDILINSPKTAEALFDANIELNGTPQWWMAACGLTNHDFAIEELLDPDSDGLKTWQEWISDTDPVDQASVLKLLPLSISANGVHASWVGGTQATQYLERSTSLESGIWETLQTNTPPTAITNSYQNTTSLDTPAFYRIKAIR